MKDVYKPERDISPSFLAKVSEWLDQFGEVLIILRYLRGGGAKDVVLCQTVTEFQSIIDRVPIGCDIMVFRQNELTLRGVVTDEFIAAALAVIPEGTEHLIVALGKMPDSFLGRSSRMDQGHEYLVEDLVDFRGIEVAVGPCPDYGRDDHEGLISASKGGFDGPR